MHPEQIKIKTVIMRGGTSKGIFIEEQALPQDPAARDKMILALFGSPDQRQIDGLGGADILTSKLAIIGPPTRADADLDYTFGQVSIDDAFVSYDINCGNISAAVGLYAIEEGYVRAVSPSTEVRIHNTNTGKVLIAHVPVKDGFPLIEGDFKIDGVPGTAAAIHLDYSKTAGSATSQLLPTGKPLDRIYIPSLDKEIALSIVDLANLSLFFKAEDVGLTGAELPHEFSDDMIHLLEEIRLRACHYLGLQENPLLPFQVAVSPKMTYQSFAAGQTVEADQIDISARLATKHGVHKAFPGTVGACTAIAAMIPGTTVHSCMNTSVEGGKRTIRLGHPSGTLPILVDVSAAGGRVDVRTVMYARTARRLMDGWAYVRKRAVEVVM